MDLRFYCDFISQPSRVLYMFLQHTKIPHEIVLIDIAKGQQLTDHFKAINRFRKVPCIVDKDFHLAESIAIVRYLAEKYKPAVADRRWYPGDNRKRARIDEYLEWHHLNIRKNCNVFIYYVYFRPLLLGTKVHPERAKALKDRMDNCLALVEREFLGDRNQFLAGDEISLADLFAACEIEQTKLTGYDPCVGKPKLAAWIERVRDAANPYYDEAHEKLYQLVAKSVPTAGVALRSSI